jgi:hypothetical protein
MKAMQTGRVWIFIRLGVVALLTWSLLAAPSARSNLEWGAAIPLGTIPGIGLYLWLSMVRYREGTDFSKAYSLNQPFWPMIKYPSRYWFVVSYSLLIGGGISMLKDVIENNDRGPVGAWFFMSGFFIAVALTLWNRKNRSSSNLPDRYPARWCDVAHRPWIIHPVNRWRYFYGTIIAVTGICFYGRFLLLGEYAHEHAVHLTPDNLWNIQYSYNGIVFYITASQDRLIRCLDILFWGLLTLAVGVGLIRGDIPGRFK